MVRIVPGDVIPLRPEALDVRFARPALEGEGAGLDALDEGVAVDEGFVGFADLVVGLFDAAVEDCGGLPFGGAALQVRWKGKLGFGDADERDCYEMVGFCFAEEAVDVDY